VTEPPDARSLAAANGVPHGSQSPIVLCLSLIAPALVWADKAIRLGRQQNAGAQFVASAPARATPLAGTNGAGGSGNRDSGRRLFSGSVLGRDVLVGVVGLAVAALLLASW
jgi:hypothetical protein